MQTTTTTTPKAGSYALWHRSAQNLPPRPVFVVTALARKVRVVDLVDSTVRRIVTREVYPSNLTSWEPAR